MENVLGVVLLILFGLFTLCSCKVASWVDKEWEEDFRREENEKEDLSSNHNK